MHIPSTRGEKNPTQRRVLQRLGLPLVASLALEPFSPFLSSFFFLPLESAILKYLGRISERRGNILRETRQLLRSKRCTEGDLHINEEAQPERRRLRAFERTKFRERAVPLSENRVEINRSHFARRRAVMNEA